MLGRTHDDALDAGPRNSAPGTERFCAATHQVKPVDEMIRFVVAPDGAAVPDLKRRLPGRGIWITATRQALGTAIARKAFARSFKRDVRVAPDLVETTERIQALDRQLILVEGAGGLLVRFDEDGSTLADLAQVIYLDHRGNGRSDAGPKDAWTLTQWGDDVRAFCDSLGIERPIVLGASFGGKVAMAYATRHPSHPANWR